MQDARLELLIASGLTEAQARVYTALAALGHTTAREVSELAGVPRTRVYPVLKSLRDLDLVRDENGSLSAGPVGPYLDERAAAASKRRAELLARRRTLLQEYRPDGPLLPPGAIRLARGPCRPATLLVRALEDASASLEASLGMESLAALLASAEIGDTLRDALRRVPRACLVIHADARDAPRLEDMPSAVLLKARIAPRDGWAYDRLVIDGAHLLMRLAHAALDDRPGEGSEVVLATRHPGLVADARAVIGHAWQASRVPLSLIQEGPCAPTHRSHAEEGERA